MKWKPKWALGVALLLLLALLVAPAHAQPIPPLPHPFYGDLTIGGNPAPVGTIISAGVAGEECGSITTTEVGKYGSPDPLEPKLIVQGDIQDGETIEFYVNGVKADQTHPFDSGADPTRLDLTAPAEALSPSPIQGGGGGGGSGGVPSTPRPGETPEPTPTTAPAVTPSPTPSPTPNPGPWGGRLDWWQWAAIGGGLLVITLGGIALWRRAH